MALVSAALTTARTLLNDDAGSVWTDANLLPKAQEAHRELQTKLWRIGSPVVREQSALTGILVSIGATDLGGSQPADLLTPYKLMEFVDGGTAATAVDMTEVNYIDFTIAQTTTLKYWAWRKEKIVFLGSTAARRVIVFYRRLITIPVVVSDDIGILFGELYIAARTAAIAAGSVGNKDVYDVLTALCRENFQAVVDAQRGQQTPVMRP